MAKRSRSSIEAEWYDLFAGWDVADQAAALKVLEILHGVKQREAGKKSTKPEPMEAANGLDQTFFNEKL